MKRYHSFIFKWLNFYIVAMSMTTVFTLSGCIEEYEADISVDDSNLLVVEGTICSKMNQFILSRTQAIYSSTTPKMVTEADVFVRGTDGSEYKAEAADGYYTCWIDNLLPDAAYYLHIEVDGEVYESEPQKPLRTEEIAEVIGVQDTPESNIDVLVTPDVPFEPDKENYYSWTFNETWEVHPDYTTFLFFDTEKKTAVFKPHQFPERGWKHAISPTILVGESRRYEGQHIQRLKLYDIDRGDERMFHKYSTLIRQRTISKDEYEYELARRQASSEMGGLFTPQPSALPTNIRCLTSNRHVLGFVGCSLNTAECRVFFYPKDFSINRPPEKDARTWSDDCNEDICCKMVERGFFLCEWEDNRPGAKLRTAWATDYQLDVRLHGADEVKPDYWED